MPPNLSDRLVPLLDAIRELQSMLATKDFEDFEHDKFLRLASERAFEIISETSRRIPNDVKAQRPEIDWLRMAGLGNHLREDYYRVDPRMLWQIAERDLPPLKDLVERVIRESEQ